MTDKNSMDADDVDQARRGDPLGSNSEIGRKLREYYEGLVSNEVPDRFSQLLSQLAGAEESPRKG